MHSAFSLSSIQSGFISCKLLYFYMPVSSCLYFTQWCAFHLLMELGNEQLYEKLLWRLLLDFERRPYHLRGRSQESLRFVTLHISRVCAWDRERDGGRRETNRTVWGYVFFFLLLKVMRPVFMITGASGEESWRRDQGIGLEKRKGKIYSTITAATKASTGPSGLQIPLLVSGRNPEGLSFLPPSKTCLNFSA